ncbi:polysaccharide deacetylase [Alteromonadaceae bacterium 2753L.S.0a.02]|nr:polysaccharide deacetylase [Alteromonadaceae bacterium 2753L.S.0a.02]
MTITKLPLVQKLLFLFCFSLAQCGTAAEAPWNGKTAAISLTYDDALAAHLDNVAPALTQHGLLATFYITANSDAFRSRIDDWRAMAMNGHELGNHTLFHPCAGNKPGRAWLSKDLYLDKWSKTRYLENLKINDTLLQAVDGKTSRSFAYPCGDTEVGGESYIPDISSEFSAARAVWGAAPKIAEVDLMSVPAKMVNGNSAKELIALVDEAIANNTWQVFLFHGVGSDYALDVSLEAHNQLVAYLAKQKSKLWVAPVDDIAKFVEQTRTTQE